MTTAVCDRVDCKTAATFRPVIVLRGPRRETRMITSLKVCALCRENVREIGDLMGGEPETLLDGLVDFVGGPPVVFTLAWIKIDSFESRMLEKIEKERASKLS